MSFRLSIYSLRRIKLKCEMVKYIQKRRDKIVRKTKEKYKTCKLVTIV